MITIKKMIERGIATWNHL